MSASNFQTSRTEKLPAMPQELKQWFFKLLKIQSNEDNEKQMVAYLCREIYDMNLEVTVDNTGNLIITKGYAEYYPCICAHMDTVHEFHNYFNPVIKKKQNRDIAMAYNKKKQVGVGGDDKCGIFACLYMLKYIDNIKVIFFTQEETGMIGSNTIDHIHFYDVGYIIQLDRWGRNDFICKYWGENTVSKTYRDIAKPVLKNYGYYKTEGLITDSITLWNNNIGISAVNVSCGYYRHHTDKETIDLNELWNSIRFTEELINTLGENLYESSPYERSYYNKKSKFKFAGNGLIEEKYDKRHMGIERAEQEYDRYILDLDVQLIMELEWMAGDQNLISYSDEVLQDYLIEFNNGYIAQGLDEIDMQTFKLKLREYYHENDLIDDEIPF